MIKDMNTPVNGVLISDSNTKYPSRSKLVLTGAVTIVDNVDGDSTDINISSAIGGVITPVNISPVNGAVNTVNTPVLQATVYQSVLGFPQHSMEVQIFLAGDLVNPVHTATVMGSANSYTVGAGVLSQGSNYYWRVRYKEDSSGTFSAWSVMTSFTTSVNSTVNTPVNGVPSNGSTEIGQTPMLTSSAFAVTGTSDTHEMSEWRIRTAAGNYNSPIWDSGWTPANLTSVYVSLLANLQPSTQYYWQVRHKGVNFGWSAWSNETSFTTAATFNLGTLLYSSSYNTTPFTVANIKNGDDFSGTIPQPTPAFGTNGSTKFAAISPDSELIITKGQGPGAQQNQISVFKRNGSVLTRLADYATVTNMVVSHAAWSPNGTYLSVALNSESIATGTIEHIFKRNPDNSLTKLTLSGTTTGGGATFYSSCTAWSPDNSHIVFYFTGSPFFSVWKNNGDDTFTKLTTPFNVTPLIPYSPSSYISSRFAAYSPDGTYLAMGCNASPYLQLYKRSGDTYTLLSDTNITGKLAVAVLGVAWSPDSQILYTTHLGGTRQITAYSRNVDTFTKITDAALDAAIGNVSNAGCSVSVSEDGNNLAVGINASPWMKLFKKTGTTSFSALTFTSPIAAAIRHLEFDRDTN